MSAGSPWGPQDVERILDIFGVTRLPEPDRDDYAEAVGEVMSGGTKKLAVRVFGSRGGRQVARVYETSHGGLWVTRRDEVTGELREIFGEHRRVAPVWSVDPILFEHPLCPRAAEVPREATPALARYRITRKIQKAVIPQSRVAEC